MNDVSFEDIAIHCLDLHQPIGVVSAQLMKMVFDGLQRLMNIGIALIDRHQLLLYRILQAHGDDLRFELGLFYARAQFGVTEEK